MKNKFIINIRRIIHQCSKFSPIIAKIGLQQCDEIISEFSFEKLVRLQNIVDIFLSKVPITNISIHKALLTQMSLALFSLDEEYNFSEIQRVESFVLVCNNFAYLAGITSTVGLAGEAFDYIILSIDPLFDKNSNKPLSYYYGMWEKAIDEYKIFNARETLMNQGAIFFYLSRILAHNYSDAHTYYNETNKWVKIGSESTTEDIKYLCYYSGILAANYKHEEAIDVLKKLKSQYEIEKDQDPYSALFIAETLTTKFGLIMEENIVEWSEKALSLNIDIHYQSKTNLNLNIYLADDHFDKEKVRETIIGYLDSLNDEISSKVINNLQRQRLSEIINRTVSVAIRQCEYQFAIEMAYIWRTYSSKNTNIELNDDAILLIAPTLRENKIIYLFYNQGETKIIEQETKVTLEYLIQVKNNFEGTWTVIANQDKPIEPKFYNQKENIYISDNYRIVLENYFLPDKVLDVINNSNIPNGNRIRVLDLTWMNTPIPQIMGLNMNHFPSVLVTDKQNRPRQIKNVLIWCDPDDTLPNSDLERDAIEYLLKKNNIRFETYSGDECSLDLFKEKYSSNEFDLIWLICHGGFEYDNPLISYLKVTPKEKIYVEELNQLTPESETRRLLVLNACQSGTSAVRYDGMGFMGLGPVLTSQSQSVIGHLWRISDFVGSILGVLLTNYLLEEGSSWGQAVNNTRSDLEKGNIHISDILRLILDPNDEFHKVLMRCTENISKLYYWASLTLFE